MISLLHLLVLTLHNLNRWLVLGVGLCAVAWVMYGWLGKRPWTPQHTAWIERFTRVANLQVLLGVTLYLLPGAFIQAILQSAAWALIMKDRLLRFFTLEHPSTMLIAVVLANIAFSVAKRTTNERVRFARISILLILAMLLILAGIPWPGSSYTRPLLRWPFS